MSAASGLLVHCFVVAFAFAMRAFAATFLLPLLGTFSVPVAAEIDLESGREHWAYQPLIPAPVPTVQDLSWPRQSIDHHLLAAMEARGLRPVADASRADLIRRATYGLTGLPPSPEEIDAFVADRSPFAFAELVERLLASSAYGERWGRHWLDIVRYADTSGSSSDHPVPEAYRYRDYVIDSFNKDKPYDQFVHEQIAGDLLEHGAGDARAEQIIATGYLAGARRFGVSGRERYLTIEDTLVNFGETFLATSLGCARCHDHTHDPVSITDYYALYGIFSSTRYPFPGSQQQKMPMDLIALSGDSQRRRVLEGRLRSISGEIKELKKRWDGAQMSDADGLRERELQEESQGVRDELASAADLAYAVADSAKTKDARVHVGGDPHDRSEKVRRGFLQVLGGQRLPKKHASSGRLELAHWMSSADNPLFARVIVNRIWGWHFGRGLVATPNDFGSFGEAPSHPGLLDYLARQFIADGYSFKTMHRRIMLSRAYGLSVGGGGDNAEIDPDARYRWRFDRRRLSAEELRDSLLVTAGLLDRRMGGGHPFPLSSEWEYSQHQPFYASYDHDRRSVYLMQQRIRRHPVLSVFDGADTNASTPQRETASSPVQALFMMNSPFAHRVAAACAARFAGAALDDAGRISAAHRIVFGRAALEEEIKLGQAFFADYRQALDDVFEDELEVEAKAFSAYARTLLSSNEFIYVD